MRAQTPLASIDLNSGVFGTRACLGTLLCDSIVSYGPFLDEHRLLE